MATTATVIRIKKFTAVPDRYGYHVTIRYPHDVTHTEFVADLHSEDIWMISRFGQIRVTDPKQYGPKLTPQWVRNFYA